MRHLLCIAIATAPTPLWAHVGHLGALGGHDNVAAGVLIGAAIAIGLWTAAKGAKAASKQTEDTPCEDDLDEGEPA